jgi:hypothetical protein
MSTQDATKTPRRDRVRELHGNGLKPREIAAVMGITTQATYKHLAAIKAEDTEREEGAA